MLLNPKPKTFYSNGKLLLTGEYVVLDGALALAVPTILGQSLSVESIGEPKIEWKSLDAQGNVWFEGVFSGEALIHKHQYALANERYSESIENRLYNILFKANQLNESFLTPYLSVGQGFRVTTIMDFPKNWGLGSSSTLINNIAQWALLDAYVLLEKTFGGSGYDIACAQHKAPITYQLLNGKRIVSTVAFNPKFKEHLYFVHLNKKQDSRKGIAHYKANQTAVSKQIPTINQLTLEMIACSNLEDFQSVMEAHEHLIATITKQTPIKAALFPDFHGSIKSLGAWGGDFVMVACKENPVDYFSKKGYHTVLEYSELIA